MDYNLEYKKRFQYKSFLDKFYNKIKNKRIKEFGSIKQSCSLVNIYHAYNQMNDIEYYSIVVLPKINNNIIFKENFLFTKSVKTIKVTTNDFITLSAIDFKISNNEKTIECKTFCRHFFKMSFQDSKNSHSKIIDSKDLEYINKFNSLFLDNTDDVINSLIQNIII